MKKVAAILLVYCSFASPLLASTNVVAYFNYATFNIPGKGPYVETYISVFGNTVQYKKMPSGKFQASVEISMLFLQNDSIKASQKYVLASPEISDTSSKGTVNFIDLRRTPLKAGLYKLELQIADKNRNEKPFVGTQDIILSFPAEQVVFSDIELIESYSKTATQTVLTKNGMDLIPYCSNFYPENLTKLGFYTEIYNTKKQLGDSSKFVVNYFIESYETKKHLNNFNKITTQKTSAVNIVLAEFNITDLPSGNYNVVAEVHDKNNAFVAERKIFFQRLNPKAKFDTDELASINIAGTFVSVYTNSDSLNDFIRSLRPISSESEKMFADNELKTATVVLKQQYLYNFWVNRSNLNPEAEWKKYQAEVKKVNKMFAATGFKGYNTDRGRVYLQYGAPDQRMVVDNEPNTYPYEIWQYYRMKVQNQTNKRFVFFNEDLSTNDYKLMHSDARGEIYDANWQMRLQKRTIQSNNTDLTKPGVGNFGNNVEDNFNNPK